MIVSRLESTDVAATKLPLLTAGHLLRKLGSIDVVQIHIDEGDKSVDHHLNDEKDDENQ